MKVLVWSVPMYGCERWTVLRKNQWVLWSAKKTSEWVLNKAGVKRELLVTVKARKVTYYDYTMRKQGNCPVKEIMPGAQLHQC